MVTFDFYNPTRIVFGSGKLDTLSQQALPGKKAMLLISCGKSTKVNGSLEKVKEQLAKAGAEYAVFDKIMENPVKEVIMESAAFAHVCHVNGIPFLSIRAVTDNGKQSGEAAFEENVEKASAISAGLCLELIARLQE